MPVPLQTQWTLVASGIVAHADHVLTGEECERLMAMVDDGVDGEEYGDWMAAIGDAEQLARRLEALELPPADQHRQILEDAWLMAVVDGLRADEEAAALQTIADRLGVETMQLDFWREAWTQAQSTFSDAAGCALSWMLGGGTEASEQDHGVIAEFVALLPTTTEHRERLEQIGRGVGNSEEAERQLRGLSPTQRRAVMQRLGVTMRGSADSEAAHTRWRELGSALRLSEAELDRMAHD